MFTISVINGGNEEILYEPGSEYSIVFSPKMTLEIGKAGSLEFTVPPQNPLYSKLSQMKSILSVELDDKELFRGRVLSNKRDFNAMRDIYVEGNLAYLVDSVQKAEKYTGKAHDLFKKIIKAHNTMVGDPTKKFIVGTINVDDCDVMLAGKSDDTTYEEAETTKFDYKQIAINSVAEEWQNTFDYIESCLTDYCGGYLRARSVERENLVKNVTYAEGKRFEDTGDSADDNNTKRCETYIEVKSGYDYSFSIETEYVNTTMRIHEYNANKEWIRQTRKTTERSITFTTSKDTKYIRFSVPIDSTNINFSRANDLYIDWLKDYYDIGTQTITVGENVIDLTEEVNIEDAFTVLIPLGDENLTIEKDDNGSVSAAFKEDGIQHDKGSIELVDVEAVKKYGRIVKTNVFDGVNKSSTLLENAKRYLKNNANVPTTITVTAVDMHIINPSIRAIYLGDKMHIESSYHGINGDDFVCTKIEYDLANPANTVYTFGQPKQSLTERYRKDKKKQNAGSRGGGGGGAAAGVSNEEEKKDLEEFFNAWINVDEDAGHIDLGTLYKKFETGKEVLKRSAGINLDAPTGIVNIYATHEELTKWNRTLRNNCGIDLDAPSGSINIFADHTQLVGAKEVLKKNVGIDLDAPDGTVKIFSMAKDVASGQEHIAQIQTWAGYDKETGKYGSKIALKSEVIELGDSVTDLINIKTKLLDIDGIVTVSSGHISAPIVAEAGSTYYINGYNAGFSEHSHKMRVDGNGTITMGEATVGENSFNMASTKFFKDKVEAAKKEGANGVTVKSVTLFNHGDSFASFTILLSNGESSLRVVRW